MRRDHFHFNEDTLRKQYDIRLLSRLLPFIKPYRLFFLGSIFLVILITLLDISLPYVTKIAIDRYIVPQPQHSAQTANGNALKQQERYLKVDPGDGDLMEMVTHYPQLFRQEKGYMVIAYKDLPKLPASDIRKLRRQDLTGVSGLALILLLIVCANFIMNFGQALVMEYTGQKIMHDLRMSLFNHVQNLSVSFFNRNPVGRLVTRVTNDIQNMYEMFTSIITFVFKDLFLLVGITLVLFSIDTKLALISLTILPVVLITALKFGSAAREAFRTMRIKLAEINSRFSETIEGIRVVQLFRQEKNNYLSFRNLNHEHYLAGMQQVRVFAVFMPIIEIMGSTAVAVVIYYGGGGVIHERITLGALVAFISYIRMFFRPIRDIAEKFNIMQNAMASAERIFLIFDKETESFDLISSDHSEDIQRIDSLEFAHVSFSYVEGEPILKDISFRLNRGESLAFVGPTGAGKTSLINLLVRFYNPESGVILINGKNISDFPLKAVRDKVALVTQDPFLFSGSIRQNISPGRPDISEEDFNHVVDTANCRSLLDKLPEGADTRLSERGDSVSSGERQLISIARALASDPELIIMDEATSYIDTESEQKIQDAMGKLMTGRTAIMIAHRLSTARNADRIMVMNHGRIIESGSHDALMEKQGFYYRLNQLQG